MGCEIRSSMEVVELGVSGTGMPVYLDKNAYSADGIILSCRLKPHNAFRGPYESGPCKMMTVGLGKQRGAERVHAAGMDKIGENIPSMAKVVLEKAPILFAIPCIENAYDQTWRIEAIDRDDILTREPPACPPCWWARATCWWWTRRGKTTPAPGWIPTSPAPFPPPTLTAA